MAERQHNFGHTVVDGRVQYFSPSSLSVADPNQYGGCLQRWWRTRVLGEKEPFTASQKTGVEVHSQIEHYLRTGEKTLGSIAMAGAHFIPRPSPENEIEFTMVETERVGEIDRIVRAPLTAAGLPVVGYGDLLIRNAESYIDDEGEHRANRPNTVEPIDWKTTTDLKNAKTGPALADTVQMIAYGEWAARTNATPVDWARLSHVTFQSKGKARAIKRSTVVSREELARRWELIEGVARTAIDVAAETDENKVPRNPASCTAWRGCPHHGCPEKRSKTLSGLFGATLSEEMKMSVLGMLNLPKPGADAAPTVTPVATPEATGVALSMTEQIAALKSKEAAAVAARATAPAPTVPKVAKAPLPAGFAAACAKVRAANLGMPTMSGAVAAAFAEATGLEISAGAGLSGSGMLGQLTLIDPAQMIQLAQEVAPAAVENAPVSGEPEPSAPPAPAGLLPQDAPASKPELAAKPIEAPAPVAAMNAEIEKTIAAAPKKSPGRPRKASKVSDVARVVGEGCTAPDDGGELEIYVNAIPTGGATDLAPYVAAICQVACKAASTDDVRVAPSKDSPLAYGGWKGVLAALARDALPNAGRYYLIVDGEIAAAIAEGLSEYVVARGVRS